VKTFLEAIALITESPAALLERCITKKVAGHVWLDGCWKVNVRNLSPITKYVIQLLASSGPHSALTTRFRLVSNHPLSLAVIMTLLVYGLSSTHQRLQGIRVLSEAATDLNELWLPIL